MQYIIAAKDIHVQSSLKYGVIICNIIEITISSIIIIKNVIFVY